MTKKLTGWAMALAVLAGGLVATPARADKVNEQPRPGILRVFDEAKIFSEAGIKKAESTMSATSFDRGLTLTVETFRRVPDDRRAAYDAAKGDPARKQAFMDSWAKALAVGDRAHGPYVLICMEAASVEVEVDRESKNRGFTQDNAKTLATNLRDAIANSAKMPEAERLAARDAGLLKAVEYVVNDLKGTKVQGTSTSPVSTNQPKKGGGMGIAGWICIGLCVLLGVWLVIGVIRALTGGGGGGGGGYGGGGYGGGGGGGGFFSSMLGGLFGAAAGMYLYNNFFGGHSSGMMGGGDAYAGDNYGGGGGDTGAGDYDGGTSAGASGGEGGDWGGGGSGGGGGDWGDSGGGGGGDWGDSGGDMGGGGDWGGGGGGDFGGGGGDF